jgi:outer membrane protein assembly factor BamB
MNRLNSVERVRRVSSGRLSSIWTPIGAFGAEIIPPFIVVVLAFLQCLNITSAQDWPMRGGSATRNNTPEGKNIADDWAIEGSRDRKSFTVLRNIKWHTALGSQSYGNPVVADGRIFVGSNNGGGFLKRFPKEDDASCLLCFRESDGKFLWQHTNMKLASGRVNDWPLQGICSTPVIEGNRLWYVSNRGEVVCLDTQGFYDNEDNGPVRDESVRIFRVERFLSGTLNRWRVHTQIRQAFEKSGTQLPFGASVGFRKKDGSWQISRYVRNRPKGQGRLPIFEVARKDDRLVAYKLTEDTPPIRASKVFEVVDDLYPSLAKNELGESLRARFAKHGHELPPDTQLTTIESGKKWKFKAVIRNVERQFELEMNDVILSCRSVVTKADKQEADVVWRFDMMGKLGTFQHNMANCSPAIFGNVLFVCTSNGVDETHQDLPAPDAPSFIAMDKSTGKILWQDNSPGKNILHGQWSSPSVGVFKGVPQVIFPGGDGWVYSFRADKWNEKKQRPILLWKFDANPKTSEWRLGGRGTRNNVISMPVIHDGRVYLTVGQDPEHGEGTGHLWCIDPTKRGDVSSELAVKVVNKKRIPLPHRRIQAVNEEAGELAIPNPNSAVIWHFGQTDSNGNGKFDLQEGMHRSISNPAIKNDLLFISDFTGLVHCLNAKTGKLHWTFDMYASIWGSPLIVDNKVYVGDEDGDITIFKLSANPEDSFKGLPDEDFSHFYDEAKREIVMPNTVSMTPIVANGILYICDRSHLYAIEKPAAKAKP